MLAGGLGFADVSDIEGCGPTALNANEMGDSMGDTTYAPSQIVDLILGSNVAPSTRKGEIESLAALVVGGARPGDASRTPDEPEVSLAG